MKRALALAATLLASGPATAQTQEAPHGADLGRTVEAVAQAWVRAEVGRVVEHAGRAGLVLEIGDNNVGPLPARQAAAMLRRLLDGRQTVGMRVGVTQVLGGSPRRGYGELSWETRPEGTTTAENLTVFLAFVLEDGSWRLTQVRLLR